MLCVCPKYLTVFVMFVHCLFTAMFNHLAQAAVVTIFISNTIRTFSHLLLNPSFLVIFIPLCIGHEKTFSYSSQKNWFRLKWNTILVALLPPKVTAHEFARSYNLIGTDKLDITGHASTYACVEFPSVKRQGVCSLYKRFTSLSIYSDSIWGISAI